jgi:hypothetical protein
LLVTIKSTPVHFIHLPDSASAFEHSQHQHKAPWEFLIDWPLFI